MLNITMNIGPYAHIHGLNYLTKLNELLHFQ